MIFNDYISYTQKYKQEYGDNTIVLMEVGSFWEIYDCHENKGANIKEIGELLNIHVSRKNKNIIEISEKNPQMAGFPTHALQRFLPILIDNNYTVVLVSQVTPPPNPKRKVTHVLSKGTYIDEMKSSDTNNIMSLFIEYNKDIRNAHTQTYSIGVAVIDTSTGQNYVYETISKPHDKMYAFHDCWRVICSYNPCEIIISGNNIPISFDEICTILSLQNKKVYNKLDLMLKDVFDVGYQNNFIKQVFKHSSNSVLSPVEFLNLERKYYACIAYITLLQFTKQHNDFLINNINMPKFMNSHEMLELSFNALEQLDVMGLNKILNKCITAIGKRYFKYKLINPIINVQDLKTSYDNIEEYITNKDRLRFCQDQLKHIHDIERLFRKMHVRKFHPMEVCFVLKSIEAIKNLTETYDEKLFNVCSKIIKKIKDVFDMNECSKCFLEEMKGNIFKKGVYDNVDNLIENKQQLISDIELFVSDLNSKNGNVFKLDSNERDGYFLIITSKRFNEIKKKHFIIGNKIGFCFETAKCSNLSSNYVKITHHSLEQITKSINSINETLFNKQKEQFEIFISEFIEHFQTDFELLVDFTGKIDFFTNNARNAIEFKYCKPCIQSSSQAETGSGNENEQSFLKGVDIRHPIIERILNEYQYVGNDIELGTKGNQHMLLYGLNAAGKSSFMKAVGLNIIMAQSGMFVPCESFIFHPFKEIFTRIQRHDDLYRGQSTFMIEISELRNILQRATTHSLIIGDELCSGTESTSAIAIVAAGIKEMEKRGSTFIFATHLHELTDFDELNFVNVYHLDVHCDPKTNKLTYNRKLLHGQGSKIYGLEVCRALDIGDSFLQIANSFRNKLTDKNDTIKKSKYNQNHIVDKCAICGGQGAEVHHIKPQKNADDNGFIGRLHKNHLSNLVTLCEKCHVQIHHDNLRIDGYVQTSSGKELIVKHEYKNDMSGINHFILNLKQTEKKTKKEILMCVLEQFDVTLSMYKLNKILKDIQNNFQ